MFGIFFFLKSMPTRRPELPGCSEVVSLRDDDAHMWIKRT